MNQKAVGSVSEAKTAVAVAGKTGRKTGLLMQRQNEQTFVTVPLSIVYVTNPAR
ncbi:hypothetical protein BSY16_4056 (plasmid) [Sinorhizobium sp. RAC02]|nr:hypothetical protein BSY16_4056 [Sinorhizobium sp. RAC02]